MGWQQRPWAMEPFWGGCLWRVDRSDVRRNGNRQAGRELAAQVPSRGVGRLPTLDDQTMGSADDVHRAVCRDVMSSVADDDRYQGAAGTAKQASAARIILPTAQSARVDAEVTNGLLGHTAGFADLSKVSEGELSETVRVSARRSSTYPTSLSFLTELFCIALHRMSPGGVFRRHTARFEPAPHDGPRRLRIEHRRRRFFACSATDLSSARTSPRHRHGVAWVFPIPPDSCEIHRW